MVSLLSQLKLDFINYNNDISKNNNNKTNQENAEENATIYQQNWGKITKILAKKRNNKLYKAKSILTSSN